MKRFIRWLLGLFGLGVTSSDSPVPPPTDDISETTVPAPKTIVPLLIFPRPAGQLTLNETIQVGDDTYYVGSPWELDTEKVDEAIGEVEEWLATALSRRIPWNPVIRIDSERTLSEWRSGQIGLIRDEVEELELPWTDDYIYLAFVRGMGGYAGGIRYENGDAGYAMVGDICLEAICEYPEPTADSTLLQGWPPNAYALDGQTGAFIHEALHGLDLPHPDGWPEDDLPGWGETLMGRWWNMPSFTGTQGLTQREIDRVLEWLPE